MKTKEKIAAALRLLKRHEQKYGTKVPKRLYEFYKSGDAFKCDEKSTPEIETPNMSGRFRLLDAVPSWEIQGQTGGLDNALFDPDGDFEGAKDCIPIFHVEQDRFFVAELNKPQCPVGFVEGETCLDEGVSPVSKSLDAFLKSLGAPKKGDIEVSNDESAEEQWDEVDELFDGDDEDEEDGDEEDEDDDEDDEDDDE